MEIFRLAIFTLLGIAFGSFLNVVIDRLPVGGSLLLPPSHCDACGRRLAAWDMLPVFSYLWLRGRCRSCGARIPFRVLLVELLGGLLFFLAFWRFGLSAEFAVTAFWGCVFLVIIFIDWEHKLILNKITYPAVALALILLAVDSLWPGVGLYSRLVFLPEPRILSGAIAGAAGFIFFLIVYLINPRGMGMGDVKLACLIGLVTDFPLVVVALMVGIIIGGVVAVVLLVMRRKGRKDVIAYGTFLAIGPIVTLLWGNYILGWYLRLFF
jgi:leader peptidase (prepilin peptidase)/N-methyltransferase